MPRTRHIVLPLDEVSFWICLAVSLALPDTRAHSSSALASLEKAPICTVLLPVAAGGVTGAGGLGTVLGVALAAAGGLLAGAGGTATGLAGTGFTATGAGCGTAGLASGRAGAVAAGPAGITCTCTGWPAGAAGGGAALPGGSRSRGRPSGSSGRAPMSITAPGFSPRTASWMTSPSPCTSMPWRSAGGTL